MQITSQENLAIEIIHFEEMDLNGLCLNKFFILNRRQAFRGREGISLLVHACHSTLSVFPSDSFFLSSLFLLLFLSLSFFFFLVLTHVVYSDVVILSRGYYCPPLLCMARVLYILPIVTDFYHFSLQLPLSGFECFYQPLLVCQLSSHHHLPVLAAPLPITKQRRLFCLLAHCGILIHPRVGVLSLSLMACTQWFQLILTSFGWYVIPAGHFPPKNLSGNPIIGFPFSPPPDHTLSYL